MLYYGVASKTQQGLLHQVQIHVSLGDQILNLLNDKLTNILEIVHFFVSEQTKLILKVFK